MDYQILFNIVLTAFGSLVMFLVININKKIDQLASADHDLILRVGELQVLIAGQYVTRSEFNTKIDAFFAKLDSIGDKLDRRSRTPDKNTTLGEY